MKVVILAGLDRSLLNFRGPLIRRMIELGHEVVAVAPDENALSGPLAELGVRFRAIELRRGGMNPVRDWKFQWKLRSLLREERCDLLLAYTIKPVVYGIPAARGAGVARRYALITGLGAAFYTKGLKGWVLRMAASLLYRRALRYCTCILVQNQEIADHFVYHGIVAPSAPLVVVAGSGVDVARFAVVPLPDGAPVFLLLARMLRDKGIEEYVAAARQVKEHIPAARFLLVGDTDPNPAAISAAQLQQWNGEGVVEYRPAVADVRPLLAGCSCYVLPSYHEGMPRSVLEAMAMGRPIITTDTIGCRETVLRAAPPDPDGIRSGDNGLLVPVRTVKPLARAMIRLAKDRSEAERMGRQGRAIAEARFDVHRVNDVMLRALGLGPTDTSAG